jgi:hypothetical protein
VLKRNRSRPTRYCGKLLAELLDEAMEERGITVKWYCEKYVTGIYSARERQSNERVTLLVRYKRKGRKDSRHFTASSGSKCSGLYLADEKLNIGLFG